MNSGCFNQVPEFYSCCEFMVRHCNTTSPITLKWVYIVFIIEFNGPVVYFKQLTNDEIIINERLHVGLLRSFYQIPMYPAQPSFHYLNAWNLNYYGHCISQQTPARYICQSNSLHASKKEHVSASIRQLTTLPYPECNVGKELYI
jgi:hypothetical protein